MSVTTVTDRTAERMSPRAWALLLVICGALFLEGIDIAMLNVAVPAIAADIGLSTGAAHWVISAYVLGYAGFMLLGGRTADLFGRRRVFLAATLAFVVFSGVGGLAGESWVLIVARFVTGVAAGFMTPAGFSIITSSFAEGTLRNRALAVYGAVGGAGFVLGMLTGGLLTSVSWRWVFFAPMVLGVIILLVGRVLIRPDEQPTTGRGTFDVGGALTVTGGMIATVFAVVSFGESRDVQSGIVGLVLGVAMLTGFFVIERQSAAPLIRLELLRKGLLPQASLAGLLFMGAFFGFQFVITLYLQNYRGWTPLETGLTFAVMGADLLVAPIVAPRLARRFGNAAVMTAGLASAAGAYFLALRLGPEWSYVDLLPSLVLVATAFALVYGPLTAAATTGLADAEHGVAGGVVNSAFQFGGALGLAAVTIALVGDGHGTDAILGDYQRALLVPAVLAVVAVAVGLAAAVRRRQLSPARSTE